MFFAEMCDALGVDRPNHQGGPIAYGFDHSVNPQQIPAIIEFTRYP
jgi:hypothetical protein